MKGYHCGIATYIRGDYEHCYKCGWIGLIGDSDSMPPDPPEPPRPPSAQPAVRQQTHHQQQPVIPPRQKPDTEYELPTAYPVLLRRIIGSILVELESIDNSIAIILMLYMQSKL